MNTTCPNCQSQDTQAVRMVIAAGTSTGLGHGVAMATGGAALAEFATTSKTELARKLDPGPAPSIGLLEFLGWAFIPLGLFIGFVMGASGGAGWGLAGLGLFLAVIGRSVTSGKKADWTQRSAEADRSWVCLRCGKVWEPQL